MFFEITCMENRPMKNAIIDLVSIKTCQQAFCQWNRIRYVCFTLWLDDSIYAKIDFNLCEKDRNFWQWIRYKDNKSNRNNSIDRLYRCVIEIDIRKHIQNETKRKKKPNKILSTLAGEHIDSRRLSKLDCNCIGRGWFKEFYVTFTWFSRIIEFRGEMSF